MPLKKLLQTTVAGKRFICDSRVVVLRFLDKGGAGQAQELSRSQILLETIKLSDRMLAEV
jgi:hypothetical protein